VVVARTLTPLRSAEILAVGSELLTPFRTDTNSLFITSRLNDLGVEVIAKSVVADHAGTLQAALRLALSRADIVVTSGGLGPTDDDLPRDAIAAVAGRDQVEQPSVVAAIEARFASRGWKMPENNRRQAMVPAGADTLDNPNGTAPGLWLSHEGRVIIALPGPPREMTPMWDTHVAPQLATLTGSGMLRRRIIRIAGRGESHVDQVAAPIYRSWTSAPVPIATTILASPGQVELHLSAHGEDRAALDQVLGEAVGELTTALGSAVYSTDGRDLEQVVADRLLALGATVAAAESCTGGLLMGRLTSVPGSSRWLTGGIVAYSNSVKVNDLGVADSTLTDHGAVSEPVAVAMARGVRRRMRATFGIGITGIAGPDGGTAAKPVGTVVICVCGPGDDDVVVKTAKLPGERAMVRRLSVQTALDMLRRACGSPDYN
jgi:nicotinamide-nucleotide amidase